MKFEQFRDHLYKLIRSSKTANELNMRLFDTTDAQIPMPFRLFLSKTFKILNKINTNTCRKSQEHFLAIYFSHKSEIKEFKRHIIALPRQWTYPRGLSLCTRYLFSSMFRRGFRSQFLPKVRHNPTVSELRVLTNEVRTEFSKNAPEIQRQKRLK
jgi:hypothetical protein